MIQIKLHRIFNRSDKPAKRGRETYTFLSLGVGNVSELFGVRKKARGQVPKPPGKRRGIDSALAWLL